MTIKKHSVRPQEICLVYLPKIVCNPPLFQFASQIDRNMAKEDVVHLIHAFKTDRMSFSRSFWQGVRLHSANHLRQWEFWEGF